MLAWFARRVLGRVGGHVAEVVARPLDVERRVGHAAEGPAAVLDVRGGLHLLAQAVLAQREGRREERLALEVEALAGRVHAVAVAVGPVVVARGEDRRRLQGVERRLEGGVDVVVARAAAALQVAVVGREGQPLAVDVGDEVGHAGRLLHVGVGHVAPEADRVRGIMAGVEVASVRHAIGVAGDGHAGGRGGGEERSQSGSEVVAHGDGTLSGGPTRVVAVR
jgi:hypothetical protein